MEQQKTSVNDDLLKSKRDDCSKCGVGVLHSRLYLRSCYNVPLFTSATQFYLENNEYFTHYLSRQCCGSALFSKGSKCKTLQLEKKLIFNDKNCIYVRTSKLQICISMLFLSELLSPGEPHTKQKTEGGS